MRFAKSTGCFYPNDTDYLSLPADIINIPQEDFDNAMRRNPGDTLDVVAGRVVVVQKAAPSVADKKAARWNDIKAKRDAAKEGGVKVGTKWFHTDEASRIQHMALHMMGASIPANLQWKTLDGTFVTMTATLAKQVFQAVAALDMAAFEKAEEHKAAMEASTDPAAYDYSDGWPAAYREQL